MELAGIMLKINKLEEEKALDNLHKHNLKIKEGGKYRVKLELWFVTDPGMLK